MILQNLHTHTTFCDGRDSAEDMVKRAIELGFHSIGFSGHAKMPQYFPVYLEDEKLKAYKTELNRLRLVYGEKIKIYTGIEYDRYSVGGTSGYDYVIGSVHYVEKDGELLDFDGSAQLAMDTIRDYYGGDGLAYARDYFHTMAGMGDAISFDIVGHFDIVSKNCEKHHLFDTECKEYKNMALEALHAISERVNLFELNTGAISRGYKSIPYPAPFILREMKALGCRMVITSDCHDRRKLDAYFPEARDMLRSFGFKETYYLDKLAGGFVPQPL